MDAFCFREPVSAWTHLCWLLLSVPCTILLWRRCRGALVKQFCFVVYGLGVSVAYSGTVFSHAVVPPPAVARRPL